MGEAEPGNKPQDIIKAILGGCICSPFQFGDARGMSPSSQLVELHGVRFIGLGALSDELTPRERVYDTLEQLTTRTDRLISVGYLLGQGVSGSEQAPVSVSEKKVSETVPLDIWNRNFPNDKSMNRDVKRLVEFIRVSSSV